MSHNEFFRLDITGVAQILFWGVAGTLAVLTYLQARRTLFQPLRVEVFKLEVALLQEASDLFALKTELALREHFDLVAILRYNTELMVERYAWSAFQARPAEGQDILGRSAEDLRGGVLIVDAEDLFELIGPPNPEEADKGTQITVQPPWNEYSHTVIHLTRRYHAAMDELEKLIKDPFLPSAMLTPLTELKDAVENDVHQVGQTLDDAASQMPDSYPRLSDLAEAKDLSWVQNRWNRRISPLEPLAKAVIAAGRRYFQPDDAGFHARAQLLRQRRAGRNAGSNEDSH